MAVSVTVDGLNCEDLAHYLEAEGVHEDVISTFVSNRISGRTFLALSDEDLKELVPIIGDRVHTRELLQRERKVTFLWLIKGVNINLVFYCFCM